MNTHSHLTEEEVALCAEAILKGQYESLAPSLHQHLAQCPQCADEVLMVADVAEIPAVKSNGRIVPFYARKAFLTVISAAAVILIAVLIIFNFSEDYNKQVALNQQDNKQAIQHDSLPDSGPAQKDNLNASDSSRFQNNTLPIDKQNQDISNSKDHQQALLASYQPDENLEKLAQNFSGSYRGSEIKIRSKNILHWHQGDSLKWINPNKELLNVEIFNNKGEKKLSLSSSNNNALIPEMPNGLYYWKLINEDFDLLFVGKILFE
ncbi:MAG: hypothetical protein GX587_03025 [Bacteroidales bacterium]|nr:hypothetical protein [Bacteroidales bacterium]